MGALARFLLVLGNLVKNGTIKKIPDAIKFAKNEFGEVTPLIKKQIEKVFELAKKPVIGKTGKKEGTLIPLARKIAEKKEEGIASLEDAPTIEGQMDKIEGASKRIDELMKEREAMYKPKPDPEQSELMNKLDDVVDTLQKNPKRPGGGLDPATGLTRALARKILDRKGIEIGKKDPIEVFSDTFGESINDVNNLAEEMLEIDRRGGGMKDMDQMLEKDGLFDIEIPTNPQRGLTDKEMLELDKKVTEEKILDNFDPTFRKPNAEGGLMRTSYAVGSGLKLAILLARKGKNLKEEIRKMIDNIFPSGDSKYDADVVLDNVLEDLNIDRDAVDGLDISKAYGEAYDMLTAQRGLRSTKVPGGKTPESSTQVFKDSEGGIKGITMGGNKDFQKAMSEAMDEGMRESENMKRLGLDPTKMDDALKYDEMKEAGQLEKNVTGSADLSPVEDLKREFPGITDEMIENILTDTNPQRIAEVKQTMREAMAMEQKGMSVDEIINTFKNQKRTKQATGGRVRAASGGLAKILNL